MGSENLQIQYTKFNPLLIVPDMNAFHLPYGQIPLSSLFSSKEISFCSLDSFERFLDSWKKT